MATTKIHQGHRDRLRGKFSKSGLDGFEEHEVLEMILYDCIPMRDTNELAHELINYYGSIWQVMEAHPDELTDKFKGMTKNAACSLSQYLKVQKYVNLNRAKNVKYLKNLGETKEYFRSLLRESLREEFYLVCLDAKFNLLYKIKVREGSVNRVSIDIREIAEIACRHNATAVAVAHSHPSGDPEPSIGDDDFTRNLYIAMNLINVYFLDHMIVGGEKVYSYWEHKRIAEFNKDFATVTKTPHSNLSAQLAQNKFLFDYYINANNAEEQNESKTV